MSDAKEVKARYICLDIERYTKRKVDAQLRIRGVLDEIVRECVGKERVLADKDKLLYLPTGDGMCIALLDIPLPTDPIHLRIALRILERLREYNGQAEHRDDEFEVRIGIHSATDYIVTDINDRPNLSGAGINTAFRIMSIADGGQVLVSEEVFLDLVRQFPHQFWPYTVTVRHGVSLPVYQFHGEAHGLNKDVPLTVEDQKRRRQVDETIVEPSLDLGLSHVYAFRSREVVRDLLEDIGGARRRVWLLGIGLHDNFDIADPEVIDLLKRKIAANPKLNLRILILDGFRSPAIFRALLESDAETSRAIVDADRRVSNPDHPYLSHEVFRNFERAHNALAEHPEFKTAVRFYGHTPTCWLAVVDDKAYFQPYTFGDISADPRVGFQMPVTLWRGRTTTLRILEDHYNRLWITSDTDLFQMGTLLKAKAETLWATFRRRGEDRRREEGGAMWFEHIHGILHNEDHKGIDLRRHLRVPCISIVLEASISWRIEGKPAEVTTAKVLDFSLEGVRLALIDHPPDSKLLKDLPEHHSQSGKEIITVLDVEPEGGWAAFKERRRKAAQSKASRRKRSRPKPPELHRIEAMENAVSAVFNTNGEFRYIRKEVIAGRPVVSLQARWAESS